MGWITCEHSTQDERSAAVAEAEEIFAETKLKLNNLNGASKKTVSNENLANIDPEDESQIYKKMFECNHIKYLIKCGKLSEYWAVKLISNSLRQRLDYKCGPAYGMDKKPYTYINIMHTRPLAVDEPEHYSERQTLVASLQCFHENREIHFVNNNTHFKLPVEIIKFLIDGLRDNPQPGNSHVRALSWFGVRD